MDRHAYFLTFLLFQVQCEVDLDTLEFHMHNPILFFLVMAAVGSLTTGIMCPLLFSVGSSRPLGSRLGDVLLFSAYVFPWFFGPGIVGALLSWLSFG